MNGLRGHGRISPQAGFTLLETLIGMALLSIMMTLLFGTIRMGARIWDSGEKRGAEVDRMLIVHSFLRHHISAARPVFDDFSSKDKVFSFSGTGHSIEFVSELPFSSLQGGIHHFRLEVVEAEESSGLVARIRRFYPSLNDNENAIEDVRLLPDIDSFKLNYYGTDEAKSEASSANWKENWQNKDFMPLLVRIMIRMQDGRYWPPIVVSPKLVDWTVKTGGSSTPFGAP
jgi:general secretion pathway protein J